jgi:hypothetical protein
MDIIKVGENKPFKMKSGSTRMLRMNVLLSAAVANTLLTDGDFDPSKVYIQLRKQVKNQPDEKIFGYQQLKVLLYVANFYNSTFDSSFSGKKWRTSIAPAVGVKGVWLLQMDLPLPGPVNVGADETLVLDVNFTPGSCSVNVDTTATQMRVGFAPCLEGYEFYQPAYEVYLLDSTKTEWSESLGDGISRIMFVNFDKAIDVADCPLMNVSFQSDRLNMNIDAADLYADRDMLFPVPYGLYYGNLQSSVDIFNGNGNHVDKCVIDISLNTLNVTANNNFVVVERQITDPQKLQLAQAKKQMHGLQGLHKAGIKGLAPAIAQHQDLVAKFSA